MKDKANAKSNKTGVVHEVVNSKPGPHTVKDTNGDLIVVEGTAYTLACGMWARAGIVSLVHEPVSCIGCIAAEGSTDARTR